MKKKFETLNEANLPAILILSFTALFLVYWFRYYFTSAPLAAWDLPGHIAIVDQLRWQLLSGNIVFYDRSWFTGFPAFQFYSFVLHLVAALLAWPLSLFASDPARLSVHCLLVTGAATLPFFVFYAGLPLARELIGEGFDRSRAAKGLLAGSAAVLSFWFLNHDEQWYGIGAAATMHIGLFSQLFAWHLLFAHLGILGLYLQQEKLAKTRAIAISFALLWLTHTLTALFALFVGLLICLWWRDRWWALVKAYLTALAVSGFWTVPFVLFTPDYTGLDIHRPTGDLLQLLLRYPIVGLVRTLKSIFEDQTILLNFGDLLIWILVVVALVHSRLKTGLLWQRWFLFALFGALVFSSGFVASSIPAGIHYYRFQTYVLLLLMLLLSVVPLCSFTVRAKTGEVEGFFLPIISALVLVAAFVSTTMHPHRERVRVIESANPSYFANEQKVLDFFRSESQVGRVFFEYFTDDRRYPWLTPHFMESELFRKAGVESVSGLFIQSSNSYRMPAASFNLLGAKTYNIPLLFTDRSNLDDQTKLQQLIEFGITHVVTGSQNLIQRLTGLLGHGPVQIGPYSIFRLTDKPFSPVDPARKEILGFYDLRGNMSFPFVEYFFYARRLLTERFDLLELRPQQKLPNQVRTILVNGAKAEENDAQLLKRLGIDTAAVNIIRLNFRNPYSIDHYSVQYQHNIELDNYNDCERYLQNEVRLPELLTSLPQQVESLPLVTMSELPEFNWQKGNQGITLRHLKPGSLYRINYSYFPFWSAENGELYRGSEERMFLVPHESEAKLSFVKLKNPAVIFGWVLTLLGGWLLYRVKER